MQPRPVTAPTAEVMATKPSVKEIANAFPNVPRFTNDGGTVESPRAHPPSPQATTLSTVDRSEKVAVAVSDEPPTPPPITVWPEVPTIAIKPAPGVQDLKGLFGGVVVNKKTEPLTD